MTETEFAALLDRSVAEKAWPGAVLAVVHGEDVALRAAVGWHTLARRRAMQRDDIFDLASLTKVVATTSVTMALVQSGQLGLDDPVVRWVPGFGADGDPELAARVTIRQLLAHCAGLPAHRRFDRLHPRTPAAERPSMVLRTGLERPPATAVAYSDIGAIALGCVLEAAGKDGLDRLAQRLVFSPLEMRDTRFVPPGAWLPRIPPTEKVGPDGKALHGTVHDENARWLGGVAGHAGLFSSAADLAVYAHELLGPGRRVFEEATVRQFTRRAGLVEGSSRCLGWDSPSGRSSGGGHLHATSFGHTGFTGTSLWIDPHHRMAVALLSNAVHPHRDAKKTSYFRWRRRLHTAVYELLGLG